jgi:hypothetical protein
VYKNLKFKEEIIMAYFLAGVADAEIFKGTESFATAKTLIDSSITIGVSAEDIRAGKGAKLYGKYFHTSTFDLKLSDAMFKMEYIAANVGADLELGGDVFRMEEHIVDEAGDASIKLDKMPKPMVAGGNVYVYYKKATEDYFKAIKLVEPTQDVTIKGAEKDTYCVKYLYENDAARKVVINANFTPDTLCVYLTANLYAGDTGNISTGTRVGTVTIKVPRFLLSGSQEIAMSMTGAANTPLEGSALATKGEGCEGEGIYAEIIEVIEAQKISDIEVLIVDGAEELEALEGEEFELKVYGRYPDSAPILIPNDKLTVEATGVTYENGLVIGKNAKGNLKITLTGTTATVTVDVNADYVAE